MKSVTASKSWVIDSSATRHFSSFKGDFKSIKRWSAPKIVRIADGKAYNIIGYGTVTVNTTHGPLELSEVWYAPVLQARLILTSALNDQGIRVILKNRKLLAIRTADNQAIFKGTGRDRLYYLNQPAEKALTAQTTAGNLTVQPTDDRKAPVETQRELWYKRFSYTSYKTIDLLPNDIIGVKLQKIPPGSQPAGNTACKYCLASRMKESFRSKTDNRFKTKLRRLHADLSGIKETSIQGYRYFLIIVDDATRATWIRFLQIKSAAEVVPQFKQLKTELKLEANTKVVFIRYDNRKGEFRAEFQSYLKEEGIQIEPCPVYKHSINGVAERIIGLIDKLVRSMLYQAKASHRLWDYTTEHTV